MSAVHSQAAIAWEASSHDRPITPPLRVIEGGAAPRTAAAPRAAERSFGIGALVSATLVALALVLVWSFVDGLRHRRVAAALDGTQTQVVTVMPGDSLWKIAEAHPLDGCTTAELVGHISQANAVTGEALQVGMQLEIPCDA